MPSNAPECPYCGKIGYLAAPGWWCPRCRCYYRSATDRGFINGSEQTMNDGGFKTIHQCESNGERCTVLHHPHSGVIIKTWVPNPPVVPWWPAT